MTTTTISGERSHIRQFLVDYFEGDDDQSMAHRVIFAESDLDAVKATIEHFVIVTDWLEQERCKMEFEKGRANAAEEALKSAKQPLHREMAALNKRVIELTHELDVLRRKQA